MKHHPSQDLPIRAKAEMLRDIAQIVQCLHTGQRSLADLLLEDLKTRALFFDEQIQQNVLMFSEQIEFQYDYDPWHHVTANVQNAADKLIEALGFSVETLSNKP